MLPLPEERQYNEETVNQRLPKWYRVKEKESNGDMKGWTPETDDIVHKSENKEITDAWRKPPKNKSSKKKSNATLSQDKITINNLKVISPVQVGGSSFPEGAILPAQVGGIPCIPGSSIRGAFLSWLRTNFQQFLEEEQEFWLKLISKDKKSWKPRKIRFETIQLDQLSPYPLHAQQTWQIFNDEKGKLAVQWQVSPRYPFGFGPAFNINIIIKPTPKQNEKEWVQQKICQFFEEQGIGRGTASGFGRLVKNLPTINDGKWTIELTGMKPCIQQHIVQNNQIEQKGEYRWSPQVLRANLRSYFTRLALAWLDREQAEALTAKIFGGFGTPARLSLTSYLIEERLNFASDNHASNQSQQSKYKNIPQKTADATWIIVVDCNSELQDLVGNLLELSTRLGGLGPGWRRPPHQMNRGVFRGSQFSYSPNQSDLPISDLIQRLYEQVKSLAQEYNYNLFNPPQQCAGGINSIWQGEPDQWKDIVHGVCRTNDNPNRPDWCGNSQNRPSGYAVRQHEQYCLVTVFDPAVEPTLRSRDFQCIWQITA
jgi:CRISPR/Cas system CMR subunit Cmr6 (Cas7 group RAMP superfamily)